MQDQQEFLPLTACTACPYGATSRCDGPTPDSYLSWGDDFIGCIDPKQQSAVYRDLHGLNSTRLQLPVRAVARLPPFIPEFVTGFSRPPPFPRRVLVGVSFTTLLSKTGNVDFRDGQHLRSELRLPRDTRVIVIGTCADAVLEKFWEDSEDRENWRRLARLSPFLSTSCSFSVWERGPRFDQIFNQERNFHSSERLLAEGVPVAPFLFFTDAKDREAALHWLSTHPNVGVVAALAQFKRKQEDVAAFLADLRAVQDCAGRPLHFLVVGLSRAVAIREAFAALSSVTIASHQPVLKARKGCETLLDLSHRKADRAIPAEQLAVRNIARFAAFCRTLRRKQSADRQLEVPF